MTPLETALDLLTRGLWPIPITAIDDPNTVSPGKAPLGKAWGIERHTARSLREAFQRYQPLEAGVGLKLGPEGGVIDIDVDEPDRAGPALARLFDGIVPPTLGWSSTRGHHWLFRWNGRLKTYGKAIIKNHPDYPGLELRLGYHPNEQQYQSVCPPSIGTNGRPREWTGGPDIAELPECFFADLDRHLLGKGRGAGKKPVLDARPVMVWDAESRATEYLKKCHPAISGRRGHDQAFKVACKVGPGFDLAPEIATRLVREVYNPVCQPPWSDRELEHKIAEAYKIEERRGWLLKEPGRNGHGHANGQAPSDAAPSEVAELADDPHRLARSYLIAGVQDDCMTLRFWLEEWHRWDGQRWRVVPQTEVKAEVVRHVKDELDRIAVEIGRPPAKVTTGIVGNVMQALSGLALLTQRECPGQPTWLGDSGEESAVAAEVIPARNGLIHLPALVEGREGLMPPTPRFFSPNALSYDFNSDAPRPDHWLAFLASVWPDDGESVAALQEWFGYLLTPDTRQQKLLVLIGPTRSGKGTITRILGALVGEQNTCSPTLSGLASNFGLAPLIGKTVAIFPDARLSGRSDSQVIVERLLSISGEDNQTIDRKHLSSWTGKLTTRFVLNSNELPRLGDSSGAITARTVILRMTRSFLGQEDTELLSRLLRELPSILLWSIAGWARLRQRGRFVQPASGLELLEDLRELSSPIGTFVEERCNLGPACEVRVKDLYAAWKEWCTERGKDHPGDEQGFGRALRAHLPMLRVQRPREDGDRVRKYIGIESKPPSF